LGLDCVLGQSQKSQKVSRVHRVSNLSFHQQAPLRQATGSGFHSPRLEPKFGNRFNGQDPPPRQQKEFGSPPPITPHVAGKASQFSDSGNLASHANLSGSPRTHHFAGHCFRCLSWGHMQRHCSNSVHCKSCFKYGHIAGVCFSRAHARGKVYRCEASADPLPSLSHSSP
jgi:hypothetical protein